MNMDMKEMLLDFVAEFGILGIMFVLVFSLVCFVFIVIFIKLLSYGRKNKREPRLTVLATVVEKRMIYSRSMYSNFYATFEVESGDRMVLYLEENEFGLLVEGDRGLLTFQGDRFCDFKRTTR